MLGDDRGVKVGGPTPPPLLLLDLPLVVHPVRVHNAAAKDVLHVGHPAGGGGPAVRAGEHPTAGVYKVPYPPPPRGEFNKSVGQEFQPFKIKAIGKKIKRRRGEGALQIWGRKSK